jgi:ribosomal protein S3
VAQKNAIKNVMGAKALGVRTQVSGRLNGVDMARTEGYTEGHVPLSTLRADIDYAMERSETLQGTIGVKVWINHGEIFAKGLNNQIKAPKQEFKKEFRKERGRS